MDYTRKHALHSLMKDLDRSEGEGLKKHSPKIAAVTVVHHASPEGGSPLDDLPPGHLEKILGHHDDAEADAEMNSMSKAGEEEDDKLRALARKKHGLE